jgi:hypothetical protein
MRRVYGAGPIHLAVHVAAFGIAAYAIAQVLNGGIVENFLIWFVGAALLHDLVFLPLYTALDRLGRFGIRSSAINYVRVPALLSGLLLLVYFPLILVKADRNYFHSVGHHVHGYARNWLLVSAAFFLLSALVYAARTFMGRLSRARPRSGP